MSKKDQQKKLRLVSATVQFHFVVDDGETLQEFELIDESGRSSLPTAIVSAKEWPDYAQNGYQNSVKELEKKINDQ